MRSLFLIILTAVSVFSQFNGMSSRSDGKTATITMYVAPGPFAMRAVTGAPYSATPTDTSVQTLPNGTHITRPAMQPEKTIRDSAGRVRTERQIGGGHPQAPNQPSWTLVEIKDPLAGYAYVLDSSNRVAHRVPIQSRPGTVEEGFGLPVGTRTLHGGEVEVTESLGSKIMSGVSVSGKQTTITYPAGSRMGNDKPVTTVQQAWWSSQLGIAVSSTSTGADGTTQTHDIPDLNVAEPDPSLFQIPADYRIVDETGSFTMTVNLQK